MKKDLFIPKLGLTMTDATITELLKKEGDKVDEGEVVIKIETDKATFDIEAPQSGFIHNIGHVGETYTVNTEVGWVVGDKKEYQSLVKVENDIREEEKSVIKANEEEVIEELQKNQQREKSEKILRISPSARRIAKEKELSLEDIEGTGPNGRIIKKDVLLAAQEKQKAGEKKIVNKILPIKGIRKIICDKMQQSLRETAQLTITMEIYADNLVRFRNNLLEAYKKKKIGLSYNAIILKVLSYVLEEYPRINSSIIEDNIYLWDTINIGVALEGKDGLLVPVIKNINKKDLNTIQTEIEGLVEREKSNELMPDELQGGTFTLTSLGFFDVEAFTPILNPPESGILGVGKIIDKPIVENGIIRVGKKMMLSFTFDHRVIDGADAARFLKRVKSYLEEPYLLSEKEIN